MSLVLTVVNAWRPSFSRLQEMADFGSNPGALRMLTFLPDNLSPRPALVVVLHGSMQSAADYDRGDTILIQPVIDLVRPSADSSSSG